VSLSLGEGVGGALATLDFGPEAGREEELGAWLAGTTLPAIYERPGVFGAHLCQADVAATQVGTEEKKLRQEPDALARWVLLIEGGDAAQLESVCLDFLSGDALARRGAASDPTLGIYQLQFLLAR
jgi:hypothetical protein